MAGLPRAKARWRPNLSPSPITRNTKRGIRSKQKIAERRENRTRKRRIARQNKRNTKPMIGLKLWNFTKGPRATAGKPTEKIKVGKQFKLTTFNCKGIMKAEMREETETYMKKHDIKILALQKTNTKQNAKEARKEYTWYFSGETKQTDSTWTAGVGSVISNDFVKYIEEIIPHTERIIQLTLK